MLSNCHPNLLEQLETNQALAPTTETLAMQVLQVLQSLQQPKDLLHSELSLQLPKQRL